MQRSSAIALIAVTAGVLVAGSVAAVAVINAASTSPEPATVAAVADPSALPTASAFDTAPVDAPSFAPGVLPSIEVADLSVASQAPAAPAVEPAAPSTAGNAKKKGGTEPSTSAKAAAKSAAQQATPAKAAAAAASETPKAVQPRQLSREEAAAVVAAQVNGTLVSAKETERGGYNAFAVTIARGDGSTVTGFVDRASGVVFDWTQTQAPAQEPAAAPQQPKPQSGEHASGGDDGGSHESGEHESEHEGGERDDD